MENRTKQTRAKINKIIGKNIRAERTARKLTREELAELVNFTTSHIGLIEQGKRGASHVTLLQLSEIFDVPLSFFFHEQNDSENSSETKHEEEIATKREEIAKLVEYLNETELEYVIDVIKEHYSNTSPVVDRNKPITK